MDTLEIQELAKTIYARLCVQGPFESEYSAQDAKTRADAAWFQAAAFFACDSAVAFKAARKRRESES